MDTDSSQRDQHSEIERSLRMGRFFGAIGKLLFLMGMGLAAIGGWFVFGPGIEGVDETSGLIIFIIAIVIALDGVFFAFFGRRITAKAEAKKAALEEAQFKR